MVATPKSADGLLKNRNRTVAKAFYRQLRSEGYTHDQIIELSSALLELVTQDLRPQPAES